MNDTSSATEAKRDREVEELLERTGVTRDSIEGREIEMLPVTGSSQIARAGYDPVSRQARVEFQSGATYEYDDLEYSVWDAFRQTFDDPNASTGQFFNKHLRPLNYRKVSEKLADAEPHPFEELGREVEKEPAGDAGGIFPSSKMIEESLTAAGANTSGAAVRVAADLVPEFGGQLRRVDPTAIAFGFPEEVDKLIVKAKLTPEQTNHLLSQFSSIFALSSQMRSRVEAITISGPEDVTAIAEAKECHKILRDERLNAEKRKKVIKEPYLRPSQLIDGVFRIWMNEIGPIEQEARAKAEYVENLEKERKKALAADRLAKLQLFEANGGTFDLGEIDDAAFELIYQGAISSYNARKAEAARIEQERLDRERAAEAERQRLQAENERLQRERAEAAAREAEAQARADEERRIREDAERELKRQEEERLAEQRRLAAEAEARRLAPDKERILNFVDEMLSLEVPEFSEPKAIEVANYIENELRDLADRIRARVLAL